MSIEKIIQESINKNPLSMKEALEEELRNRLALALEEKMADMAENLDEAHGVFRKGGSIGEKRPTGAIKVHDNPEDAAAHAKRLNKQLSPGEKKYYGIKYHVKPIKEGFAVVEEDMDESFDLSDLTLEELEGFMESADFDQLDEYTQEAIADYYYEALTPEQKRARELNRVEPRKGGGDSLSGRKGSDTDYTHTRVRGMKGAEKTKETSGLTKWGKEKMSKLGKHGYAYDNSSSRAFKPNAKTSLAKTKMINRKIHRKDGMMGGNYGKSKLPESNEE